jgi:hypothetical protein
MRNQWGGARKGAGRPNKGNRDCQISARIDATTAAQLRKLVKRGESQADTLIAVINACTAMAEHGVDWREYGSLDEEEAEN